MGLDGGREGCRWQAPSGTWGPAGDAWLNLNIADPAVLAEYPQLPVRWKHAGEIRLRYGYSDFTSQPLISPCSSGSTAKPGSTTSDPGLCVSEWPDAYGRDWLAWRHRSWWAHWRLCWWCPTVSAARSWTACAVLRSAPTPTLAVTNTATLAGTGAGPVITDTVGVSDTGTADASGVRVTDPAVGDESLTSVTPASGSGITCTGDTCAIGTLTAGGPPEDFTFTYALPSYDLATRLTNTATASATNATSVSAKATVRLAPAPSPTACATGAATYHGIVDHAIKTTGPACLIDARMSKGCQLLPEQ